MMDLAATVLGDRSRDSVGIVPGLEAKVEVQPVLRSVLGARLLAQFQDGSP